jgi:hypothetical protein
MRSIIQFAMVAIVFGYFAACAPVKFAGVGDAAGENVAGADVCPRVCAADGKSCVLRCEVEKTAGAGLVDILIVNDNSGSMSTEQKRMGQRFPDFLNSIGALDYRIAMTTTDISSAYSAMAGGQNNGPSAINQYGKLQDGNLIEFQSGLKFLTKDTPGKDSLFLNTVQRQETLNCEMSGYRNCPSSDERGIYAMNLVLDRTSQEFFRPTAHLAVIVLSDEDERGISDSRSTQTSVKYPLESYDKPETFVSKMAQRYPGKTYSVHSIVVVPGDQGCLAAQAEGANIWGVEGYSYQKLSNATRGTVGTICSNDYGAQLGSISSSIQTQIAALPFHCRPIGDQYKVTFSPQPTGNTRTSADFSKMLLTVVDPLPAMTKVRLTYDCAIPE